MFQPRIIPVLLLENNSLIKTVKFKDPKYIGDPINAVHLFNQFKADELVFLDINATKEKRTPSLDLIEQVGEEANMPFAVGGGIRSIETIKQVLNRGAEKVVINTFAIENPKFIQDASNYFGSSTISVCIDVKKSILSGLGTYTNRGKIRSNFKPVEFAQLMEKMGVGEIILQSIDRDGQMSGYDINLIRSISESTSVPLVALGAAGKNNDFIEAYEVGHASALGAGSHFIFQDKSRGVLINYPSKTQITFH